MRSAKIQFLFALALGLGAWLGATARCSAQPLGRSVLVAAGTGGLEQAFGGLSEIERELARRRLPAISMHEARDRFEQHSHSPSTASASDLDTLGKEARQALEHVAFGRTGAAEQSVRQIIALAERSLETLNRETATARQLLDACLALVRASAHDGKRDLAIEQAMRCRRLVPDLSPSESSHPANVVGVLAEADDQLRRMRVGSLRVQNRPERSCALYLNGRHLGTTPFALDRAAIGEYRVQVECDDSAPGRVHVVQLGDEPTELLVDLDFDAAIVTEPRLALRYQSATDARSKLVEHAVQLGREVRAEDVLLWHDDGARVELLRVQVRHQRLVAGFALAKSARRELSADTLTPAIDALAQGRFVGVDAERYRASPHVATAPYTIRTKPADARLLLDGSIALRDPEDVLPLRLGNHVLEVRAEGYRSAVRDLQVQDTSAKRLEIALAPTVDGASREVKPLRKKWWFWTTLGVVAAAGVTTGLVLGLRDGGSGSGETTIDVPD